MKVLNFYKTEDQTVNIVLDINNDVFDVILSEKDFSKWEDLAKGANENIDESEEERFLDLVDVTDGDFYAARKKFNVIKTIEKQPKQFLIEVQNHWLWKD